MVSDDGFSGDRLLERDVWQAAMLLQAVPKVSPQHQPVDAPSHRVVRDRVNFEHNWDVSGAVVILPLGEDHSRLAYFRAACTVDELLGDSSLGTNQRDAVLIRAKQKPVEARDLVDSAFTLASLALVFCYDLLRRFLVQIDFKQVLAPLSCYHQRVPAVFEHFLDPLLL